MVVVNNSFEIHMPSDEEMRSISAEWYKRVGWSFIDQWPEAVASLSIPTKFVKVDASRLVRFWEHQPDLVVAQETADLLDAEMGWRNWFVRLNSRSPKDGCPADDPLTCSGKTAVSWIMASERCLDDISLFSHLDEPLYICLREPRYMDKDGEFRCFAKDGHVLGVSRYFYTDEAKEAPPSDDCLFGAASDFYREHLARHYDNVVFDLYAPGTPRSFLIEINPYGLSDPCCFESYEYLEANPGVRHAVPSLPNPES